MINKSEIISSGFKPGFVCHSVAELSLVGVVIKTWQSGKTVVCRVRFWEADQSKISAAGLGFGKSALRFREANIPAAQLSQSASKSLETLGKIVLI